MEPTPNKPSQAPNHLQKLSYYLLVGFILTFGIYFLVQGIAQFWQTKMEVESTSGLRMISMPVA